MATVTICDRCNETVKPETGGKVSTSSDAYDLCLSCWKDWRRFITEPPPKAG